MAWRHDFAAGSPEVELGRLRPDGLPDVGVELDPAATHLRLDGLVMPRDLFTQTARDELKDQSLRWMVKVLGSQGLLDGQTVISRSRSPISSARSSLRSRFTPCGSNAASETEGPTTER